MATITNSYCSSSVTAIEIKVRSFRRLQSPLTWLMLRGLCLLLFCPPFPRQFLAGSAPRADEPFLSVSRGACACSCGSARSPSGTAPDGSGAGLWDAWGDDILGGAFLEHKVAQLFWHPFPSLAAHALLHRVSSK